MPEQADSFTMKDSFNLINLVCNSLAACVTPFLRIGFGKEYPGAAGLFGLIIMLVYGGLGKEPEMFTYVGCWLLVVVCQRLVTWMLARKAKDGGFRARLVGKGFSLHSRYWGYPWIAFLVMPLVKRESIAVCLIEPLLCLGLGYWLMDASPGVGGFVMAAGIASGVAAAIVFLVQRKKLQALRDAEIEQLSLATRFRSESQEI
jgi:hypothetical protein